MDFLVLLDQLDDAIANAKPVPLSGHVRIDKEEFYEILDEMRATIPDEIRQARRPQPTWSGSRRPAGGCSTALTVSTPSSAGSSATFAPRSARWWGRSAMAPARFIATSSE